MRRMFVLEELDCANCAAKMEAAIAKIPGVKFASVNYLTQKLTLEAEEGGFDGALALAAAAIKRIEPGCRIVM